MPLEIVRNDICRMQVDAIVNAANDRLAPGGGVCGAIHAAAGPELARACAAIGGCETGDARRTRAFKLPCKYVIHAVGPIWRGGGAGEEELLASCYRRSLELALEANCESIAFPLISSGIYGYPKDAALRVATDTLSRFLLESERELQVYLVVFDRASFQIGEKLRARIAQYIDDRYADAHADSRRRLRAESDAACAPFDFMEKRAHRAGKKARGVCAVPDAQAKPRLEEAIYGCASIEDALARLEEGFSQALLREIDARGMKDTDCYKRANIDRKLFSKIRKDPHYRPKKQTALALAVALRLDLRETNALLKKAGYALSRSSVADVIVEFFIQNGRYDVFEINEALYSFDQPLLGGRA